MHSRTVFIVDDDAGVRDALTLLLSMHGYATAVFARAEDFLATLQSDWSGVVITDIRLPGMSGLDMQAALAGHPSRLPVIIVTGHGDIPSVRRALKANASDFLEKPLDTARLLDAVAAAMRQCDSRCASAPSAPPGPSKLTAREREVMGFVVDGLDNRAVGQQLNISPRTVQVHKSRLMLKLGVRNLADLMRAYSPGLSKWSDR